MKDNKMLLYCQEIFTKMQDEIRRNSYKFPLQEVKEESSNITFRPTNHNDLPTLIKYRKALKNLVIESIEDADDVSELFLEELNELNKRINKIGI